MIKEIFFLLNFISTSMIRIVTRNDEIARSGAQQPSSLGPFGV